MIVSFSVSNFRSFAAEQTLSLVADSRMHGCHPDHECSIPGSTATVLKTAILYGANGAGKSNLFEALRYLQKIALHPGRKSGGMGRQPFRFGTAMDEPSAFDLQFIADNQLFRYGIRIDDHKVLAEWLYAVTATGEERLYERITDEQGNVCVESDREYFRAGKLGAMLTVGGPQNQSFLATIQAILDSPDYASELAHVIGWFTDNLAFIEPGAFFLDLGHLLTGDAEFLAFASDFLRSADTGVHGLQPQKTEISEDEARGLLSKDRFSRLVEAADKNKDSKAGIHLKRGNDFNDILLEHGDKDRFYRLSIQAAHEHRPGQSVALDLREESDGTRRLLHLLPALHILQSGNAVFFIDEIDRSMHPALARQFLEFFLNSCRGGRHQIIFTTHETNLLDLKLLRRDEIWFTEKDRSGASHLYSLADFEIRPDQDIRTRYLQGRYGAIPFLGDLHGLLQNRNTPDEPDPESETQTARP